MKWVYWIVGIFFSGCLIVMLWAEYQSTHATPHMRKQPYVRLNTEEKIHKGDTLYVCAATDDTIDVWGK